MMKETGIIMSGNHPQLVQDGLKTMTRRVIIPQPPATLLNPTLVSRDSASPSGYSFISDEYGEIQLKCPYGQVGDRLWVRETWAVEYVYDKHKPIDIPQRARVYYKTQDLRGIAFVGKWRPSLFMPRWAARLTLEITEVRVERLQEIIREDIRLEGVVLPPSPKYTPREFSELHQEFAELWDSLNAKRGYGWETNPWVWVLGFKLIRG